MTTDWSSSCRWIEQEYKNQWDHTVQIHEILKEDENLVVVDYKMKYETLYFWGKTLEHFIEKGTSWMEPWYIARNEMKSTNDVDDRNVLG